MDFRCALITGASSGIGAALARELVVGGAHVVLLARRAEKLAELAEELGADAVTAIPVDVTDPGALERAIERADAEALARGVPLDLVIANAGIAESGLKEGSPEDGADEIFRVNAAAAIRTLELGRRAMAPRGRGHLAVVSSLAGLRGLPGAAAYCASKAAVRAYAEGMRFDLRAEGLGITDVCPGFIRTPLTDRNRFPMPFLMDPGPAARRIVLGLRRRRRTLTFPRRLAWPWSLAVRTVPASLLDRVLAGRGGQ